VKTWIVVDEVRLTKVEISMANDDEVMKKPKP
jgi:hypothetical protein